MVNYFQSSSYLLYLATFSAPFYPFIPTNSGIFEIVAMGSALFLAFSRKKWVFPDRLVILGLSGILFGYSISIILASEPIEALKLPLQFIFIICVVFPLYYTHIFNIRDIYKHMTVLVSSLWIINIIFLVRFVELGIPYSNYRYSLIYSNPNTLSHIILLLSSFCMILLYINIKEKNEIGIIYTLSTLSISMFPNVLSLSRSGLLGLFTFIVIMLATGFGSKNSVQTILARGIILTTVGIGAVLIGYTIGILPDGLIMRITATLDPDSLSIVDRVIGYRLGVEVLLDSPLLGTGYNNYTNVVIEFADTPLEESFALLPHNIFFSVLVEGGIIALAGIVCIAGTLSTRWFSMLIKNKTTEQQIMFCIATISVVYFGVKMVGTFSVHRIYWVMICLSFISIQLAVDSN